MIEFGSGFDQSMAAPFIRHLWETHAGTLHIMVSLASVGQLGSGQTVGDAVVDEILGRCRPVTADESCTYEIIFEDYILYQTRNESYFQWKDEVRTGKYFTIFSHSRLLDQLPHFTLCQKSNDGTYFPGKWTHYGIYAQDRVVDVIAYKEPIIVKRNGVVKKKRFVVK